MNSALAEEVSATAATTAQVIGQVAFAPPALTVRVITGAQQAVEE
ncbi:hypothetical protein [Streptomyces sp. RKCA744]|nr:hypothetical protein [Streptomyces sp. RKCA744]